MGFSTIAAIIGAVATAGSAVVGVVGASNAAAAAKETAAAQTQAANYNAAVADQNAKIATNQAQQATASAAAQEQASRMKTKAAIGNAMTSEAANGLDINSGTNVQVQAGIGELGDLDALTIRNNGARAAYGYNAQAANFSDQATLDRMGGVQAQAAGQIGASAATLTSVSSILGGASSLSSKWSDWQKSGVIGSSSPIGAVGGSGLGS